MRLKFILLLFSFTLLIRCNNDDPVLECVCAAQEFSIEILNTEGSNLIQNGTYNFTDIQVILNGIDVTSAHNESQTEVVFEMRGTTGINRYTIILNDSETDLLVLNESIEDPSIVCCPYTKVTSALYNGQEQEVMTSNDALRLQKITITK